MKFSAVLALGALSTANAMVPNYLQQAPLAEQEKFLIELGPGETRWITEDEKWELRRVCRKSNLPFPLYSDVLC
jgi:leucyl aminopeptidase